MAAIGRWTISPSEMKRYGIDYSEWLNAAEKIVSVSHEVSPRTGPLFEVTGSLVTGNGMGVVFFVGGGVSGVDYRVTTTVTTNTGQVKQDTVLYLVRGN